MKNAIKLMAVFVVLGLLLASVLWAQQVKTDHQAGQVQPSQAARPQAEKAAPPCPAMKSAAPQAQASAPAPAQAGHDPSAMGQKAPMAGPSQHTQAEHEPMMAEMKAMDARLDEKLTAMNASQGNAKIDAMAAVITEMVNQRKIMQQKMMMGQYAMMGQMSAHHSMRRMAECPMTPAKPGAPSPPVPHEGMSQ
jgi:hypothetical protein